MLQVELATVPRVPDHLHTDLPANGPATMIGIVLERSRRLCLQQYQKELLAPDSYLDAFSRCQDRLTRQQLAVFAGLRSNPLTLPALFNALIHLSVSRMFTTIIAAYSLCKSCIRPCTSSCLSHVQGCLPGVTGLPGNGTRAQALSCPKCCS